MRRQKKQYRSSDTGSFMIDRQIRGIGRIHRASGLTVESQFNTLNDAIPDLAKSKKGRALLEAFRDGTIGGVQLFVAVRSQDLDMLSTGDAAAPLLETLTSWNEQTRAGMADATYKGRLQLIKSVTANAPKHATIADLPKTLRAMKLAMPSARQFNLELQYASAFVRDTIGRRHSLYLDVRDIDVRKTPKATERHPLSPLEIQTLATAFNRIWKAKKGSRGDEVFAMALTGMGPAEYWGRWKVLSDRVHIDGTKREARVRDIPRLFPCAIYAGETIQRPAITSESFSRALNIASIATNIDCTPYDLRRTVGNWMEAAQILRSRRKQYLGHAIGDVTERYERHELQQHLVADGEKLRAWIALSIEGASSGPTTKKAKP